MALRSPCIPPVSTVYHGAQIIGHSTSQCSTTWCSDHRVSTSQYSTPWCSDHRAFHRSVQYTMVLRSSCIPPVSRVYHGAQIIVHSTSQCSTTWCSDHRAFHQTAQYYVVLRSSGIPPVSTVHHGAQSESLWEQMRDLEINANLLFSVGNRARNCTLLCITRLTG